MKIAAREVLNSFQDRGIRKSYTIAFSIRCGSTVVANTLSTLGLGEPTEFFQHPYTSNSLFQKSGDRQYSIPFGSFCWLTREMGCAAPRWRTTIALIFECHLRHHLDGYDSIDDVLPGHKWIFSGEKT